MKEKTDKTSTTQPKALANKVSAPKGNGVADVQFNDKRQQAGKIAQLQAMANGGGASPVQRVEEEDEVKQPKLKTVQRAVNEKGIQNKNATAQKKADKPTNNTGLPDNLKTGMENLSGFSLDDVKVHYNSPEPAQLKAHAFAQGTDIHMAPGQEKHLPHEAWHVVQQKQGRVKPTMQMKGKVNVNDDAGLEKEADVMGAKAIDGDNV